MNRVKLTVSDESGKTLCKMGTSIDKPAGFEYSDMELADALLGMVDTLKAAHAQRVETLTKKWAAVLDPKPSGSNVKAILLEAQERPIHN